MFCGEWCIGRIYETRTGPEALRWFWALHAPSKPGIAHHNRAATLDEAKAEFEASWKQWKAWAGLERDNIADTQRLLDMLTPVPLGRLASPASPRGFFFTDC